jgi:hypothetical protein
MWDLGAAVMVALGVFVGWVIGARKRGSATTVPLTRRGGGNADAQSRIAVLQREKSAILETNKQLRQAVEKYDRLHEAAHDFVGNMRGHRRPEFVNEEFLFGSYDHRDVERLHTWAAEGAKTWRVVDQMSPSAKRNLEETCLLTVQGSPIAATEPVSAVLESVIRLFREKPRAIEKALFEFSTEDFRHLERWSTFLTELGWPAYSSLCALTNAANVAWYAATRDQDGEEEKACGS